jgi:hypothetical protein
VSHRRDILCHLKDVTNKESVWKQGSEKDIRAYEEYINSNMEKITE